MLRNVIPNRLYGNEFKFTLFSVIELLANKERHFYSMLSCTSKMNYKMYTIEMNKYKRLLLVDTPGQFFTKSSAYEVCTVHKIESQTHFECKKKLFRYTYKYGCHFAHNLCTQYKVKLSVSSTNWFFVMHKYFNAVIVCQSMSIIYSVP